MKRVGLKKWLFLISTYLRIFKIMEETIWSGVGIILFVVAIISLIVTLSRKINKALKKSAEILKDAVSKTGEKVKESSIKSIEKKV